MSPNQLVEVCKQAYHQEEIESAEDSDLSPKVVGHNVYILAYQLAKHNKELAEILKVEETEEATSDNPALEYYSKHTAQIEVVRADRVMEQINFPVPTICEYLTEKKKSEIYHSCERDEHNSKVADFFEKSEDLYKEMIWQQKLRNYTMLYWFSRHLGLWENIAYYLAIIINVLVGFFYPFSDTPIELDRRLSILIWFTIFVSFIVSVTVPRAPGIRTLACAIILRLIFTIGITWTLMIIGLANLLIRLTLMISYVGYNGALHSKEFRDVVTDQELIIHLTCVIISANGLFAHEFFFSLLMVDFILREETLMNVIKSVSRNLRSILLTAVLALILVYGFSIVGFLFFQDDFQMEVSNPNGTEEEAADDFKEKACDNLLMCIITVLNQGLRSGGGIGDVLRAPSKTDRFFFARVLYDLLFFFIVIIIVLNLIFGVIIDTFADLRTENQNKDEILKNTCFICGLPRSNFDNRSVTFDHHINNEHNMWDYLYFIVLIKVKDPTEFTGPESYVSEMIKERNLDWFPHLRCMSLTVDEGESEQNEIRNLQDKLTATNDLVNVLSKQLRELHEQMMEQRKNKQKIGLLNTSGNNRTLNGPGLLSSRDSLNL